MNLPWIQTRSGIAFTPTAPRIEDILIEDIAWSLAHQPRFKGHTRKPYTVAEHCWIMSFMVSPEAAMGALLHDGAEAYVGDIPAPLKHLAPGLVKAEDDILCLIEEKWFPNITDAAINEIHTCDKWIVHEEANLLMGPRPRPWFPQPGFSPRMQMPTYDRIGVPASEAYGNFMMRFETLKYRQEKAA